MILLAESGSTKTEWCLVSKTTVSEHSFTDGINPYFESRKEISHTIRLQLPEIFFKTKIQSIYFYGAGCSSVEKKSVVKASLESQFRTPAFVESDLLGAARSLFNKQAGIACILGTGSNSCFYDGEEITKNVRPLGFILGDEGSGAFLGKAFLSDCLKGLAPDELVTPFYKKYGIDPEQILDYVYSKPFPNRLLAVLSFYLSENLGHPYVYDLVYNSFRAFFERNVLQYDCQNYPVRFCGSVAKKYSSMLKKVSTDLGIVIDSITENPVEGLIQYHRSNLKF